MKKWLSYLLVFGLLLACAGCSKQDLETATDVSSVASQGVTASIGEELSVPAQSNPAQSTPVESEPVESTPSQPQELPEKPAVKETSLDFSQWNGISKSLDDYPEIPNKVLCHSFKELQSYLSLFEESFSWAENYTDEYFKTNSLLLSYQDNSRYTIEKITLSENLLTVSWKKEEPIIDMVCMELEPIEIYASLEDVKEMKMVFRSYIQGSFEKEYTKVYAVK